MADKIGNGARLTAQSWKALREHRQLLVFPLVSGLVLTVVTTVFVASLLGTGVVEGVTGADEAGRSGSTILGLIELFIFYLVCYTVVIFSNTALVGAVLRLADGQSATVGDGFRVAVRRLPTIVVYALISATIGLLARGIAQSGRSSNNILVAIVAALVGALVQGAWTLVVFFAIPVIGGISCLAYLLVILGAGALIGLGVAQAIPALIVLGIVGAIVLFAALALLSGAVNGVFQASLYRYATSGDAGALIDTADAATAFRVEGEAISPRA